LSRPDGALAVSPARARDRLTATLERFRQMHTLVTATGLRLESYVTEPDRITPAERQAWRDFCQGNAHLASPFLTHTYASCVAAVRPGVRVCVVRQNNQLVAFLPFQFATKAHEWIGAAERVGGELSDSFGLVAAPGLRLSSGELLKLAGLSSFYFTHLLESQSAYGLAGTKSNKGLLIQLEDGAEEYWEQIVPRNRKFHSELRRLRKKLQNQYGDLKFTLRETAPDRHIQHLVKQKKEQYQRTSHSDSLKPEWSVKLLHVLAASNEQDCRGVVSTLYAGETWVASHVGIAGGGTFCMWFPVYNPELRTYSPGHLLLQSIIDHLHQEGAYIIDRGEGDTPAKRLFATGEYELQRGLWTRRNLRSCVYRASCSLKWRLEGLHGASSVAES
jgi:CelD/BcsL family acetyltransferase involved in cellulose biosynthesis